MSVGIAILVLSTPHERLSPMDTSNLYYGDDFGYFEDDEPLTPEEQARADRAYYQQQEQEAYAEFLQSPYCFDWGNIFGQIFCNKMVTKSRNH